MPSRVACVLQADQTELWISDGHSSRRSSCVGVENSGAASPNSFSPIADLSKTIRQEIRSPYQLQRDPAKKGLEAFGKRHPQFLGATPLCALPNLRVLQSCLFFFSVS